MLNATKPYISGATNFGTEMNWSDFSDGYNVHDEMTTAGALNPFTGVAAYNPTGELDAIDDRFDLFSDLVDDIDPQDIMDQASEQARLISESILTGTTQITTAVTAHRAATEEDYQRRVSAELATLLAGRAVMSSGFDDAVVAMANRREAEIQDFSSRLGIAFEERKNQAVAQLIGQYIGIVQLQLTSAQGATALRADLAKQRILAMQDQINIDLGYDEAETKWVLSLFDYKNAVMASYRGAVTVPKEMGKGERALSMLSGALTTGISVGTATGSPQIGVIAGAGSAILGGLLSAWK
jgi:hypothetical protein